MNNWSLSLMPWDNRQIFGGYWEAQFFVVGRRTECSSRVIGQYYWPSVLFLPGNGLLALFSWLLTNNERGSSSTTAQIKYVYNIIYLYNIIYCVQRQTSISSGNSLLTTYLIDRCSVELPGHFNMIISYYRLLSWPANVVVIRRVIHRVPCHQTIDSGQSLKIVNIVNDNYRRNIFELRDSLMYSVKQSKKLKPFSFIFQFESLISPLLLVYIV